MYQILLALFGVIFLLFISEQLWRAKLVRGEPARKFAHIAIGLWVAAWPWLISFRAITIIATVFAIVIGCLIYFHNRIADIIQSINTALKGNPLRATVVAVLATLGLDGLLDVRRKTWGEVLFAVGAGMTALLFPNRWLFAVAILHLALADGLAAIIGQRYGKSSTFKVFDGKKSFVGSVVYFVCSVAILLIVSWLYLRGDAQGVGLSLGVIIPVAFLSTVTEGISVHGADNLTVPLVTAMMLKAFL